MIASPVSGHFERVNTWWGVDLTNLLPDITLWYVNQSVFLTE
jgi:hypothetical protein